MAAEIKKDVGIESELVRGSGGVFVVTVDNQVIFSKKDAGRFPEPGEIVGKLRGMRGAAG